MVPMGAVGWARGKVVVGNQSAPRSLGVVVGSVLADIQ